jgi:hypothetical protein
MCLMSAWQPRTCPPPNIQAAALNRALEKVRHAVILFTWHSCIVLELYLLRCTRSHSRQRALKVQGVRLGTLDPQKKTR